MLPVRRWYNLIIYTNDFYGVIDDCRVSIRECVSNGNSMDSIKFNKVYIDGMYFMDALILYVEHKQYKELYNNFSKEAINKLFGQFNCILFIDLGSRGVADDGSEEFKDYTAKAREGISYFEDVITQHDKDCVYMKNYMEAEVRL